MYQRLKKLPYDSQHSSVNMTINWFMMAAAAFLNTGEPSRCVRRCDFHHQASVVLGIIMRVTVKNIYRTLDWRKQDLGACKDGADSV